MAQIIGSKLEFEQILKTFNGVILLDFFADWCGPCRMLAPVMDELSGQYDEHQVKILKVNVDQVPELAQEYGIVSIPTVFVGVNHQIAEGFLGAHPKAFYEEKIADYLTKVENSEGKITA